MAKQRYVNTRFWVDGYISNLDPIEKLLFLYFLTNPSTEISGVYEVPLKTVATDTGIDKEMVIKVLRRFEKDEKIKYRDGWVAIKNFIKHQSENPKIIRGIEIALQSCPSWTIGYVYPMDRLSHSNSNSNTNSNTNSETETSSVVEKPKFSIMGAEVLKLFEEINPACKKMYANKTQRGACDFLVETYGFDRVKAIIEKTLPKTNGMDYFPRITTPLKLQDKWVDLEVAVKSYQSKKTAEVEKRGHVYI